MNYKNVDKETYYRKGVFKHFTQDCKCSTSITARIDVEFFSKIEEAINKYGGTITIYDTIDLQLARKRYIPIG